MVLAIVLGPLAERSLRQSLLGSQGDMMVFLDRPLSATFVVLAVALFAFPIVQTIRRRKRQGAPAGEG
jgi:putative tricarboxylic transport membrane protein